MSTHHALHSITLLIPWHNCLELILHAYQAEMIGKHIWEPPLSGALIFPADFHSDTAQGYNVNHLLSSVHLYSATLWEFCEKLNPGWIRAYLVFCLFITQIRPKISYKNIMIRTSHWSISDSSITYWQIKVCVHWFILLLPLPLSPSCHSRPNPTQSNLPCSNPSP